jgi:2,4-dienoyl-CoA reductase-like NADH-dependent reductase (Old Yellow Enzyme family)
MIPGGAQMAKIRRIFEPIKVGNLELRNRIKMPASTRSKP